MTNRSVSTHSNVRLVNIHSKLCQISQYPLQAIPNQSISIYSQTISVNINSKQCQISQCPFKPWQVSQYQLIVRSVNIDAKSYQISEYPLKVILDQSIFTW